MRYSFQPKPYEPEPLDPALVFLAKVAVGISFVICGCLFVAWTVVGIIAVMLWPLSL